MATSCTGLDDKGRKGRALCFMSFLESESAAEIEAGIIPENNFVMMEHYGSVTMAVLDCINSGVSFQGGGTQFASKE